MSDNQPERAYNIQVDATVVSKDLGEALGEMLTAVTRLADEKGSEVGNYTLINHGAICGYLDVTETRMDDREGMN